jgi:hypothetical protein
MRPAGAETSPRLGSQTTSGQGRCDFLWTTSIYPRRTDSAGCPEGVVTAEALA